MVDSGKHTPGPWYAISDGPVAKLFNSTVIVSEHIDDAIICSIGRDVPGDEANVRLITAAPELLEALEAIVDSAHDGREYPGWLHERLEQLAIPAIRKAVGDGR